mgnify:CR=1 FL=1|jgi:hypothetical protein
MKIIARMGHQKYLLEVDLNELRALNPDIDPEIGVEYDVLNAAQTLKSLRSVRKIRLVKVAQEIEALQRLYRKICDDFADVMILDTIANSESDND